MSFSQKIESKTRKKRKKVHYNPQKNLKKNAGSAWQLIILNIDKLKRSLLCNVGRVYMPFSRKNNTKKL